MVSPSPDVGLLVVHGIGEQHPLDTARKVVRGLEHVYGVDLLCLGEDHDRGTIDLQLRGGPKRVRLYDVHWAPLFDKKAKGSFIMETVLSVATFPLLNRRHHLYRPARPLAPVLLRTLPLLPLSALAYLGLWGVRVLGMFARFPDVESPHQSAGGPWWRRLFDTTRQHAKSTSDEYTRLDAVLDKFAGDVFQYVGGSVPTRAEASDADVVRAKFWECLEAARVDGCGEVQVLAHSLGTVVAYNALTGYGIPEEQMDDQDRPVEVTRLWTIGSPLEKIAFFFPVMTQADPVVAYRTSPALGVLHGDAKQPAWVNFRNPLDPVAGRLRSFPGWRVDNRRVWAGGVGRSHVVYERNPRFLEALTESLFGSARTQSVPRRTRLLGFLVALLESVALMLLLVVPIVLGAALLLATAGLVPWLAGWLVGLVASDATADEVRFWGLRTLSVMFVITLLIARLLQSVDAHRAWQDPSI